MATTQHPELTKTICVIGSGAAGLITAHTLLRDGFTNVDVISRDSSAGGIWAAERVYPGLVINNVHGEFRFSHQPMPAPTNSEETGGRLSGDDMRKYMESFAERFLKGRIRYNMDVLRISRHAPSKDGASTTKGWTIDVMDRKTESQFQLDYDKVVLCSGGCSEPYTPSTLTESAAKEAGFTGPVFHSAQLRKNMDSILAAVKPITDVNPGRAIVIGGGRSAQDAAAFLANQGRKVSVVFETADAVIATQSPVPEVIRKSRLMSILSPHAELNTNLERFLHNTWVGSQITHGIWNALGSNSFSALSVPQNSPLRNSHSLFWEARTNDEGKTNPYRFHGLVAAGKIKLIAPNRVEKFGSDGHSVVLSDGTRVEADAVIVATGFKSSWGKMFDRNTLVKLGLERESASSRNINYTEETNYASLSGTTLPHPAKPNYKFPACIYRGIVPAENILEHDFAINGAIMSANNGYTFEVASHWIASYFRKDRFLDMPASVGEAVIQTERHNAWLRQRYPGAHGALSESYSGDITFFNWPQTTDALLQDMSLRTMRSGGSFLTWPFKSIDISEIADLTEEREEKRISQPVW
ncbi:uncharacterized protein PHACADRAFT_211704 [Phanerochaete carnosa HHB-10118-sp]|uniref:FAD/NAD(P)-binding domain-containing protein n=1 Tax=Phanerochaete carnosa (strain HHB-10118-sp) TaxID=650164 RepID=K5WQ28_PHACS|nr:uncharacterized protein PHACADRAFT_211704 [Phanerochaete carnosa HHB-10118-sp]EKM52447.1 hypothetical protein PHACADRAFT_211704 [Phanerochaete carnosa HHB-10118-sp]